jgi:hypothetical protein
MIAAGILGGIAVVMLQITKDQASQSVKSKVSNDLAQFKSRLLALILNPANCNANFAGLAASTTHTPSQIYSCTLAGAHCQAGPGSANTGITYPVDTADWVSNNTKISDRIRVEGISIAVSSTTATRAISNAKVTITLNTRPDMMKNGVQTYKTETINIDVPVVLQGSGTIQGCPKAWNSTVIYGNTI